MNREIKKYCDSCEHVVELSEDGYCLECGKHADNMRLPTKLTRETNYQPGQRMIVTNTHFHTYELGQVVIILCADWHSYHVHDTEGKNWWWLKEWQMKPL